MSIWKVLAVAGAAALLTLGACDRQSAKPARDAFKVGKEAKFGVRAARKAEKMNQGKGGRDAGPTHADGTPMWASNRKRTAEELAQKQFQRNGAEFGATTVQDYVDKAHAFTGNPPAGTRTATRGNGDKLFYDPKSNTFAVLSRRGGPRTMFKPRDGEAYWTQQLATLDQFGKGKGGKGGRKRDRADAADNADDNG